MTTALLGTGISMKKGAGFNYGHFFVEVPIPS
jgi:hypothetical protein